MVEITEDVKKRSKALREALCLENMSIQEHEYLRSEGFAQLNSLQYSADSMVEECQYSVFLQTLIGDVAKEMKTSVEEAKKFLNEPTKEILSDPKKSQEYVLRHKILIKALDEDDNRKNFTEKEV